MSSKTPLEQLKESPETVRIESKIIPRAETHEVAAEHISDRIPRPMQHVGKVFAAPVNPLSRLKQMVQTLDGESDSIPPFNPQRYNHRLQTAPTEFVLATVQTLLKPALFRTDEELDRLVRALPTEKIPVLEGLDTDLARVLLRSAFLTVVPSGDVLIRQGEVGADEFYVTVAGALMVQVQMERTRDRSDLLRATSDVVELEGGEKHIRGRRIVRLDVGGGFVSVGPGRARQRRIPLPVWSGGAYRWGEGNFSSSESKKESGGDVGESGKEEGAEEEGKKAKEDGGDEVGSIPTLPPPLIDADRIVRTLEKGKVESWVQCVASGADLEGTNGPSQHRLYARALENAKKRREARAKRKEARAKRRAAAMFRFGAVPAAKVLGKRAARATWGGLRRSRIGGPAIQAVKGPKYRPRTPPDSPKSQYAEVLDDSEPFSRLDDGPDALREALHESDIEDEGKAAKAWHTINVVGVLEGFGERAVARGAAESRKASVVADSDAALLTVPGSVYRAVAEQKRQRETSRCLAALQKSAAFAEAFDQDSLHRLARVARLRRYTPGDVLIRQGQPLHSAFVLVEGAALTKRLVEAPAVLVRGLQRLPSAAAIMGARAEGGDVDVTDVVMGRKIGAVERHWGKIDDATNDDSDDEKHNPENHHKKRTNLVPQKEIPIGTTKAVAKLIRKAQETRVELSKSRQIRDDRLREHLGAKPLHGAPSWKAHEKKLADESKPTKADDDEVDEELLDSPKGRRRRRGGLSGPGAKSKRRFMVEADVESLRPPGTIAFVDLLSSFASRELPPPGTAAAEAHAIARIRQQEAHKADDSSSDAKVDAAEEIRAGTLARGTSDAWASFTVVFTSVAEVCEVPARELREEARSLPHRLWAALLSEAERTPSDAAVRARLAQNFCWDVLAVRIARERSVVKNTGIRGLHPSLGAAATSTMHELEKATQSLAPLALGVPMTTTGSAFSDHEICSILAAHDTPKTLENPPEPAINDPTTIPSAKPKKKTTFQLPDDSSSKSSTTSSRQPQYTSLFLKRKYGGTISPREPRPLPSSTPLKTDLESSSTPTPPKKKATDSPETMIEAVNSLRIADVLSGVRASQVRRTAEGLATQRRIRSGSNGGIRNSDAAHERLLGAFQASSAAGELDKEREELLKLAASSEVRDKFEELIGTRIRSPQKGADEDDEAALHYSLLRQDDGLKRVPSLLRFHQSVISAERDARKYADAVSQSNVNSMHQSNLADPHGLLLPFSVPRLVLRLDAARRRHGIDRRHDPIPQKPTSEKPIQSARSAPRHLHHRKVVQPPSLSARDPPNHPSSSNHSAQSSPLSTGKSVSSAFTFSSEAQNRAMAKPSPEDNQRQSKSKQRFPLRSSLSTSKKQKSSKAIIPTKLQATSTRSAALPAPPSTSSVKIKHTRFSITPANQPPNMQAVQPTHPASSQSSSPVNHLRSISPISDTILDTASPSTSSSPIQPSSSPIPRVPPEELQPPSPDPQPPKHHHPPKLDPSPSPSDSMSSLSSASTLPEVDEPSLASPIQMPMTSLLPASRLRARERESAARSARARRVLDSTIGRDLGRRADGDRTGFVRVGHLVFGKRTHIHGVGDVSLPFETSERAGPAHARDVDRRARAFIRSTQTH